MKTMVRVTSGLSILLLLTAVQTVPAHATKCYYYGDGNGKHSFKGTRKYKDSTLWDNYIDGGGDENTQKTKYYILNDDSSDQIDDIQILVWDDGDRGLVARTVRGKNVTKSSYLGGKGAYAVFYVPWEEGWRVQVEYRWEGGSKSYERITDAKPDSTWDGVKVQQGGSDPTYWLMFSCS